MFNKRGGGAMEKVAKNINISAVTCARKRKLSEISLSPGGRIWHEGKEYVNFSSNDYLALSGHPGIISAAGAALFPQVGTASSRLMTGNTSYHRLLEDKIAEFKNKPAALVFNSGYQANVGVISFLVGHGDCVFSDRLNHASIVDGIKLSGARCFRFRHNDAAHLEDLIQKYRKNFKKALIVTESVFSMDGDEAPLKDIVDIKNSHACVLMVDEAHATGVFGPEGSGMAGESGLSGEIDIVMGTFSKALGVFGSYVATETELKELLVNGCRSLIYSTALPVSIISGCLAAIDAVRNESWRREELLLKAAHFRQNVKVDIVPGRSQIVPVLVGDDLGALAMAEALKTKGWWVTAIRPPTVPLGGARLRVSITMHHDIGTLDRFIDDINRLLERRP